MYETMKNMNGYFTLDIFLKKNFKSNRFKCSKVELTLRNCLKDPLPFQAQKLHQKYPTSLVCCN